MFQSCPYYNLFYECAIIRENQNVAEVAEAMYQVSAEESARSILRARRKYEEVYTSAINGRARAEIERLKG